ncbi:MAG: hypothetical protein H6540_00055 [Bacteroidales bacterium]|nr:hypothetical protein [Bacteroidales bacterium]
MGISESAARLRKLIDAAIDDHKLTRAEYEEILAEASRDSHIDPHEQALLNQLQK